MGNEIPVRSANGGPLPMHGGFAIADQLAHGASTAAWGGMLRTCASAMQAAAMRDALLSRGWVYGLTAAETAEVIDAWVDWSAKTPFAIDWDGVRSAVERRATGKAWRPDDPTAIAQGSAVVQTVTKRAACGGGV